MVVVVVWHLMSLYKYYHIHRGKNSTRNVEFRLMNKWKPRRILKKIDQPGPSNFSNFLSKFFIYVECTTFIDFFILFSSKYWVSVDFKSKLLGKKIFQHVRRIHWNKVGMSNERMIFIVTSKFLSIKYLCNYN